MGGEKGPSGGTRTLLPCIVVPLEHTLKRPSLIAPMYAVLNSGKSDPRQEMMGAKTTLCMTAALF